MKSYSKVFKASHVTVMEEVKVITPPIQVHHLGEDETALLANGEAGENIPSTSRLLEETEAKVSDMLANAKQQARTLEAEAEAKIQQWWIDNEQKLAETSQEARQFGYQEGFELGKQEARLAIQQEYQAKMDQVEQLLEQAFEQKQAIIAEAEPFLLELSTAIASQIVQDELKSRPDHFVEIIKQHILRFKEKEFITICVHPDDFEFIQSQRSHLVAVVNGETEVKVIPDHSVTPKGCIIRTAYGSVDARIDTQIEEIKKVILEAGRNPDHGAIS